MMPSARALRDEAVRLEHEDTNLASVDARSRAALETMELLYERLRDFPEELHELDAAALDAYDAEVLSGPVSGRFAYRNVELDWPAESRAWRWPLERFDDYEEMLERAVALRILGECWGMSKVMHPAPGGAVLLTSGDPHGLPGLRVEWVGDRVRCSLGSTFAEVHDFLDGTGKTLANQPGFAGLTVAGNIGTGGHGSGLGLGPLASMVQRIELGSIKPAGKGRVFLRGDPDFDCAATHLGRLGPVLAIELDVVPEFHIAEERKIVVLGGKDGCWRTDLAALVRGAVELQERRDVHSAEIWISPYVEDDEIVAALGVRSYTTDPVSRDAKRPSVLRFEALQTLGRVVSVIVASLNPRWIRRLLRTTVKATETERVVMTARDGLDFGAPNVNRMGAIEMAVDISNGPDASAVVRTIEKLEELATTRERFVFSPIGIRFVGQGPADGLSPHAGRERTMHLELPTFGDDSVYKGNEVLEPVQRMLAEEFQGRPHWGQRIYLAPEELRRLWPPKAIARMASLVRRLDPEGIFANPLLDPFLGL